MRRPLALVAVAIASVGSDCTRGHGPIAADIMAPLGEPLPSATPAQRAAFERGRAVALRRFDIGEGLGPSFNVTFCASCHERPVTGGSAGLYRNFFLTAIVDDSGAWFPAPSGGIVAGGVQRLYHQGDGDGVDPHPAVDPEIDVFAQRNPIPFFGVGLLAEIPDDEILSRADPDDDDGDGISGRPNYDRGFVGRFGRKSQTVSIEGFIRGPLFNHMGVTTDPLTDAQKARLPVDSSGGQAAVLQRLLGPWAQAAAPDAPLTDDDGVADPEMSTDDLFDLVSFAMLLAAPLQEPLTEREARGRDAFDQVGCADCHTPRLRGPRGLIPAYSDLLLHDLGPDLADGVEQGEATGSEFRTQPLWGLAAVGPYLHDGRATTITEAIEAHAGEARAARDAWRDLPRAERLDLEAFLLSLGGRDQYTPGLLPPGAPIPPPGRFGAPAAGLGPEQMAAFEAGRAAFDEDFGVSDGVGSPRLNGDSCRACHFDPVIGGSGPRGVNVIRHGTVDVNGVFHAPPTGTILHRTTVPDGTGIYAPPGTNVYELRQTPALFGLGLLDALDDAVILANADPDDTDDDGISGRPHVLPDGRLGRFGWKAQVPSLAEFVRDAGTAELGLTVAEIPGQTFGATTDGDDISDPELDATRMADIAAFMRLLAPPPPRPRDATATAGEAAFDAVGCAACHLPALGGVPAYTDLLLHDMLPPGAPGIVDGDATMREFRTAPLWGIAASAPYGHSGGADTLDQAIRGHDGEAAASRAAYEAATEAERAAILAFLATL